jgi:DNA polymerase-1
MSTLLLVDGHSQAYRAYFGLKTPLTTRAGEPTTAVYGFARKLLSVLKEYRPEFVAVAFDLGDTWRHVEFGDYKATRERMPDDMRTQMTRIEQFLQTFNIPVVTYPNYEADDVLGALARQASAQGVDVLIMTGDRDMFQLVDERVKILYTSGGPKPVTSVVDVAEVQERYGLTPTQFIDFKALIGDSSDNIPGVPGVGEKTAVKLLQQFGSLNQIYQRIGEVNGAKLKDALVEYREQVLRNLRLVTISTQLDDLVFDAEACRLRNYDQRAVVALFEELEFRSLIKELPETDQAHSVDETPAATAEGQMALFSGKAEETGGVALTASHSYLTVQDADALQQVIDVLASAPHFSFDVETTSTDAMQAKLVGLGVAWGPGQAAYIPISHTEGDQLPWGQVRNAIQPFFADPSLPKLGHNTKYDLTVCLQHGLDVAGPIHDTMVLAWLLDPGSRSLGLKAQAAAELGVQMTELSEIIGTGKKQITIDQAPIPLVASYCGADVDSTIQLFGKLAPRVKESGVWPIYEEIELPLLPVLTDMERAGILLDTRFLAHMSQRLSQRLIELERELVQIVGHEFNLRSTQQMGQVLFGEMAFPTRGIAKTASGHFSTAVGELEKLYVQKNLLSADQLRLLEIIFEQRQLEKLRGTYVDALPALVNPHTGRVHTSFNQAGAVTGRMSSSDPNLQNIPIRTELGREIRQAFVAPPGWSLISADYSQVELRILAHVAGEESLIAAFNDDQDIHVATAGRLFGVPMDQVTKDQRGLAKTINFATVYGSSAFGISSRTEMDPKQAQQFLDQYFVMYPKIAAYIEETKAAANRDGYVQTLLGRKRFFPELSNPKLPFNQRGALERQAINAPIQGTAADIMKIAMVRLHRALRESGVRARMLLQVHDELVLETPPEEAEEVARLTRTIMSSAYRLVVPLKVDVEMGPNWYDLTTVV